jgi:hypothetical protein
MKKNTPAFGSVRGAGISSLRARDAHDGWGGPSLRRAAAAAATLLPPLQPLPPPPPPHIVCARASRYCCLDPS